MNLLEGLFAEMNRLRDVAIPRYQELGPAGEFAIMCMRVDILEAEAAIASGDTVVMLRKYAQLKELGKS
jgi:hypothetical protein